MSTWRLACACLPFANIFLPEFNACRSSHELPPSREYSRDSFSTSAKVLSTFLLVGVSGPPLNMVGRSHRTKPTSIFPVSRFAGSRPNRLSLTFERRSSSTKMKAVSLRPDVDSLDRKRHIRKIPEVANHTINDIYGKEAAMKLLQYICPSENTTRVVHDDIRPRRRCGRELAIPQEERYTTSDWRHILMTWPRSTVLKRIRGPILTNMVWATLVSGVFSYLDFPAKLYTQLHSLIGSALGLLLVFRTNAAYQRFWEGRMVWESLLGDARGLSRMCMMYNSEITQEKTSRVANLICLFSSLLAEHLGHSSTNKILFRTLIERRERQQLEQSFNRPLWVINTLGKEIKDIPDTTVNGAPLFSSRERLQMLSYVDKMCSSLGKCERLVQTPVPLNYVRHTSRVLTLWCFTLPFALAKGLGFVTVPVVAMLTWVLYGIQEIGLMIEDPFKDALNLDVFVKSIFEDVFETSSMTRHEADPDIR